MPRILPVEEMEAGVVFSASRVRILVLGIVVAVAGCRNTVEQAQDEWQIRSQELSEEQRARQQALLVEYGFWRQDPEKLVGQSADDFADLLKLADTVGTRGEERTYQFRTEGANDDGTAGQLEVHTDSGRVNRVAHHGLED